MAEDDAPPPPFPPPSSSSSPSGDDERRILPSFTYRRTAELIPSQPTTRSYGPAVDPSSNSHMIPSISSSSLLDVDVNVDAYDIPDRRLPKFTIGP